MERGVIMVNYVFDEENGIIRDKATGERYIIVSKSRTEDIFGRLSQIFKSGLRFFSVNQAVQQAKT